MTESINKLNHYLALIDTALTTDHTAKWGLMNAQQMVEHLSFLFLASAGKWGRTFTGDEARAAKMKANFFAVQYPFPKSVPLPGSNNTTPPPLRETTMEGSKSLLKKTAQKYFDHYKANPTDKVQHPYFGLLNFEEWTNFQIKHTEHHLMQFGLLPYPLTDEMEANLALIGEKLKTVYAEVTTDHPAKWGLMNAHQMVEHLTVTFLYSTGKFNVPFKGDLAAAKKLWQPFVEATNPWKTVFPSFPGGNPRPPRNETIEGSKKALKKTFIKYQHYCKENPDAITPHGFLGNITTAQWILAHVKHIDHHLSQFGVIEELV